MNPDTSCIVDIELNDRGYPIFIGPNLLSDSDCFFPYVAGSAVLVVTNETVAPLYLRKIRDALSGLNVSEMVLPDGEQYKTLDTVNSIFTRLLEQRFDRSSTLLALGGGVIGDITGFAAACYQRGISFIQAPTTLLAQVDSSVGGKTGVNHPLGKNMIGAFHQPKCVVSDTTTLDTLDDRQLSAGLAEVIKYGLVGDLDFYVWLEGNMEALVQRDNDALVYAIERSCRNKAKIVEADERESGRRALLNLGHTFGHAIENAVGYGRWMHGEAVAAGTCLAARMSHKLGWIGKDDLERVENLFRRANLPTERPKDIALDRFLELMSLDKKVMDGTQRLVLLESIGKATVTADFDQEVLKRTILDCQ